MGVKKKVEAIRNDVTLSGEERIWKAIVLIASHLDEGDDLDFLGAVFGGD